MESIKVSQNGLRVFKQTAIIEDLRSLKKWNATTEKWLVMKTRKLKPL